MNKFKNTTISGVVTTRPGVLNSVTVNSHTSGTLQFIDGLEKGTAATTTLTSSGACVPASHATSKLTSSGAMVAGTHAVTVFTGTANFQEGVKASAILTSDQTQPTVGKVVVVGDVTYTFVALGAASTFGATACNVPLGNNTAETMGNLYNAILRNPLVDTVRTSTYVITVTAKTVGTAGNSIAATEDDSHLDWDDSNTTLTGGVAADTITIGTTVYTAKSIPSAAYDFLIGSTLTASLLNLKNAINGTASYAGTVAHTQVIATASNATTITIRGRVPGTSLNTVATTETCANASFPDSTLGGGTGASDAGVTVAAATITIGTTVYTAVDALSETYGATAIPYQVVKGANEAALIANLKLAINGTGVAGTNYSTGTVAHPSVVCSASDATTLTIVSRVVGNAALTAVINAIPTTETMANTAWADSTLGGGTGDSNPAVTSDAALIVIGNRTYTAVVELSETSGASPVADQILWETSEAVFLDNLKSAINSTGTLGTKYSTGTAIHSQVIATTNSNTEQTFVAKLLGVVGNSYATSTTLANYAFTSTVMASGAGSTGRVIINTITLTATASLTDTNRTIELGEVSFDNGLFLEIGGVADVTVSYK